MADAALIPQLVKLARRQAELAPRQHVTRGEAPTPEYGSAPNDERLLEVQRAMPAKTRHVAYATALGMYTPASAAMSLCTNALCISTTSDSRGSSRYVLMRQPPGLLM